METNYLELIWTHFCSITGGGIHSSQNPTMNLKIYTPYFVQIAYVPPHYCKRSTVLTELRGDLFSHHGCHLEGAVFLS